MKKIIIRTHLLIASWVLIGTASTGFTSQVGDPSSGADLPAAIVKAYASGSRDITIAPGVYRIPPTGKGAISLEQWTNATLQARGVTIVFEELSQRPIRLSRCENVTLKGATLRFAEPSFTQGRVKAIAADEHGQYLDWQIDAGYPVFDPTKSTFDVVDQNTRLLKTGTGDTGCKSVESMGGGLFRLRQFNGGVGPTAVNDWLFTRRPGGGSTIIHLDNCNHCTLSKITLQNSGFAAFFETGGAGGHHYVDCRVVPGPKPAGAVEEQLVGCGADGFHSAGTRVGPTIERCVWEGVLHDDCIAIHGSFQKIFRVEGNKLIMEPGNRGGFASGDPVRISSDTGYFGEFACTKVGEISETIQCQELTLSNADEKENSQVQENLRKLSVQEPIKISGTTGASGEFIFWSARQTTGNEYVFAVTPGIPAGLGHGTLLEIHPNDSLKITSNRGRVGNFFCKTNRSTERKQGFLQVSLDRKCGAPAAAKASNPNHNGAGFKILNCTLGNCRSRGILVKADNGLIRDCTISGCGMSAISIGPEYWWGEADYSKNVVVTGNTLRNNVLNGSAAGVIFVHGDGAMGNGNLAITDNTFERNYGQIAIHAEDTDGITITHNQFETSPLVLSNRCRTVLDFKFTKNIVLRKNTVVNPSPGDTLVSLGKNVGEVAGNDPSGIVSRDKRAK